MSRRVLSGSVLLRVGCMRLRLARILSCIAGMRVCLTAGIAVVALAVAKPAGAQTYVPEFGDPAMKVRPVVPVAAYSFPLQDIRLLDGPFKVAMMADLRYLLLIGPDRLLSGFRAHAGLKPKGEKYGGWESSGLAGHTLGHYLSACSMAYAATGDGRFRDRVKYVVGELALCQLARKSGYIGAIPREDSLWAEVAAGKIHSHGFDLNGAWSPWYTVHKIMAGLLDAYLYTGNTEALRVERGMADWTAGIVAHLSDSTRQKMLACEYGGMNEVLVNTYAITGEKKFLDLSYDFYDRRVLDSLSMGLDDLAGKHSNTQIPKVIGSARRYELTACGKDKRIAQAFWSMVVSRHSYATGGNSDYEYFGVPGKLNDELTDNTTETCTSYNMLKLTRHLFAWHPSAALMDYYERTLYNHILASQNHRDGMTCYFVPLRMGGRKEYSDSFNTFTCCVGSGMENHVKYGQEIYSRGADGSLYVNLFIPSRLDWSARGIRIEQLSRIPAGDKVILRVAQARTASRMAIRIRKPYWAGRNIRVSVNGVASRKWSVGADGYIAIRRTWKAGDRVVVTLPEDFHSEGLPDNASRVALFYGPVLLAGELGNREPDPVAGIPVLVSTTPDPNKWIRRLPGDSLAFRTVSAGAPEEIRLIPFNRTVDEYYSVYWDFFTPQTWAVQQEKYREARLMAQDLEDRTIDQLRLGEMQPERDHDFAGEHLQDGEAHGRHWRSAGDGGYFSFRMRVDPASQNILVCEYWGDDHRGRTWEIRVDGQTIATQNLSSFRQSKFYEVNYAVPAALIKGKQSVTVTFAALSPHNSVGPVSGTIRMVRE